MDELLTWYRVLAVGCLCRDNDTAAFTVNCQCKINRACTDGSRDGQKFSIGCFNSLDST